MRFLLTNDDGIAAEGLDALHRVLEPLGSVCVVAPEEPMSSCGHRVTTDRPLATRQIGPGRYAVAGAPADCVRLGLLHFAADADWVISGINAGGNLGIDVFMSGTVAAVREGSLFGRPGIAFSQYRQRGDCFRWDRARQMAAATLERLLAERLEPGEFWNVNFPAVGNGDALPELAECRAEPQPLAVQYERRGDDFHYRGVYQARPRHDGTDVDLCFRGYITASRLSSAVVAPPPAPRSSPRTT